MTEVLDLASRFAVATEIQDHLNRLGTDVMTVEFGVGFPDAQTHAPTIGTYYAVAALARTWDLTSDRREDLAAELLKMEGAALARDHGRLFISGEMSGLSYLISLGEGVCERVVVGQRLVPAVEEHYEDVVEIRCPDPIVAAGLVEAVAP